MERKAFTVLPKSPDSLPRAFKVLPKAQDEELEISQSENQYIKEAHQSFVVLGKTNSADIDVIEESLEITSMSSATEVSRFSEDNL